MFGLGFSEILLILIVVLLVFGPKQLPEVARSLGQMLGELRRTMDDVRREIVLSPHETQPPTLPEEKKTPDSD
ncbi:MAG TPA: twin-arginine translocase TatA/TatE family subunit, partial [Oligoflexia bacterium]|nr:twin-arginine translocase TatA/TatE family subunit [Oligoflexia bacterium]